MVATATFCLLYTINWSSSLLRSFKTSKSVDGVPKQHYDRKMGWEDGGPGVGMAMAVAVEYLGDSISSELLCKFPDNSAFDFDYSQSSIWSPLLPHPPPSSSDHLLTARVLSFDEAEEDDRRRMLVAAVKQVSANIKNKIAAALFGNSRTMKLRNKHGKKKMKKAAASGFSPSPVSGKENAPTPSKGWSKILRVASKRFKKANRKKGPTSHLWLSNCLMDGHV
ncbi:uncharacterized protein LOC127793956 [Diospyros lotus]|uniref:uncharacterized protein LOC127793956 n=1 Tax=Diospyros lotus TaxID=55363 RepID=UPI0022557E65|nr:uncharacterized protein LOC127793956 [Diospyros lotus]